MTINKNLYSDVQDGQTNGSQAAALVNDNKRAVNNVIDYINTFDAERGTAAVQDMATDSEVVSGTAGKVPDAEQVRKNHVAQVATISALRTLEPMFAGQQVEILGHTVAGVGGGVFYHDASDTTSIDDDKYCVVTTTGNRWKLKDEAIPSATGQSIAPVAYLRVLSDLSNSVPVSMKAFGAIGNDIDDDRLAVQDSLEAVFSYDNAVIQFDPGKIYYCDGAVAVDVNTVRRNSTLLGHGSKIRFSNAGGVKLSAIAGGQIEGVNIHGLALSGGTDQLVFEAASTSRYLYAIDLSGVRSTGALGDAIKFSGNVFEAAIKNPVVTLSQSNLTGAGFKLEGNGGGVISSIDIFGGTFRYGKNGLLAESPVNDLRMYGGTYLFAQEDGVRIDAGIGVGIYGTHVEGNWEGAADIASGGAGLRFAGSGEIAGVYGICNSSQNQKYVVRAYATDLTISGGAKAGSVTKYGYYQQATNSALTLIGAAANNYDAIGTVIPTTVSGGGVAANQITTRVNFKSYSTSVAFDLSLGAACKVGDLTGNITISAPTNSASNRITITLTQDSVGGHAVTWDSSFAVSTAIDTTAYKKSVWVFERIDSKWREVGFNTSF